VKIPRRFIRTVPEAVDDEHERFWHELQRLHPGWKFLTYRDPIPPASFPETAPLWDRCEYGAQKANLIRLEALYRLGGVYLDADIEPLANLDHLLGEPFAAWEDGSVVSNAVMGFPPFHPALRACLDVHLALFPGPPMPSISTASRRYSAVSWFSNRRCAETSNLALREGRRSGVQSQCRAAVPFTSPRRSTT
jgi:hypothetical protein